MNIVEIKKAVGKIKTAIFKNSNSFSMGMLKSHFKGTGLHFREHQVYTHGDDTRFIDWKLSAKMNNVYIKTFEEERNVEIVVIVDATGTMLSGFENVSKLQMALEICCLLYLLAEEIGDYVEVMIAAGKMIHLPKKRGDAGIAMLLSALEKEGVLTSTGRVNQEYRANEVMTEKDKTNSIMRHMKKRRELVFLSDFHNFLEIEAIKKLSYKRNVHCFQLLSPLDESGAIPYMIHCHNGSGVESVSKINLSDESKDMASFLGKKFRKLRVQERYLEAFIKEML